MSATPQYCERCHRPLPPGARYCEWCGHPVTARPTPDAWAPPVPPATPETWVPPAPFAPPQAPPRRRPNLLVAFLLGGALIVLLLVAVGGAVLLWRGQGGGTPTAAISRRSTEVPTPRTQPARPTLAAELGPPVAPAPASLESLVGEWEVVEGDEADVGMRFRLALQADGRLRLRVVDEYTDIEGIEEIEQIYLELAPDGEGLWVGDSVVTYRDSGMEEALEASREPVAIRLLADGEMIVVGPPESEGVSARRVSGP